MKTKKLRTLLIIVLCFVLAFTGCSKAEDSADTKTVTNSIPVAETGKSDETTGPASTKGVSDTGSSSPDVVKSETIDFGYSDATGSARSYAESASDSVLAESKFSLKDSAYSAAESPVLAGDTSAKIAMGDDYIYEDPMPKDPDPVEPITREVQITAGLLTAGEWNDNKNFDFLKNLISDGQSYDYSKFFTNWKFSPFNRLVIKCSSNGTSVAGAKVSVLDGSENVIWKGVSDHEGMVYAYYALIDSKNIPYQVVAEFNGSVQSYIVTKDDLIDPDPISITFEEYTPLSKTLDLMFTVDTTGSMGDEIFYLQKELENVINRVKSDSANIPVRLSVNFYRDISDDYVVRPYEFSDDIDTQLTYLNKEYAAGGGDFEEAVEQALANAVKDHEWDENSIKLLFLVLDAPPHNTEQIQKTLAETLQKASEKGIRIIPVASSGIDKDTEFLLRTFAMTTGGTYTFLTDDSGIGGSHIEPTVGDYTVEHLNDLLVRIIEEYIG